MFEILAEAEEDDLGGTEKEITVVSFPVVEASGELAEVRGTEEPEALGPPPVLDVWLARVLPEPVCESVLATEPVSAVESVDDSTTGTTDTIVSGAEEECCPKRLAARTVLEVVVSSEEERLVVDAALWLLTETTVLAVEFNTPSCRCCIWPPG